ncbi:MAG: RHS repeat-associated core domain-containing protein [Elusimicrobia bacterium]|nr:RHS repeat-associated core domain-containing protein [Elusimicrobiota bacterium]
MSFLRRVFVSLLALSIAVGPGGLDVYAATIPPIVLPPAQVMITDEAKCVPCVITDGVNSIISAVTLFLWEGSPGIAGMPVYNSANLTPSVWGRGWISDMDHYATINSSGSVTVVGGSGAQFTFTKTGTTGGVPTYRGPLGTFLTLTATVGAGGAVTSLTERDGEGTSLLFATPTPATVGGEPLAPGAVTALRLTRLTDRNGNTVDYKRDSQGRLTKVLDIHGRYFALTYDAQGKVATLADSGGRAVAFSYDTQGRKTTETGPEGTTGYAYDANHRLTRITYPNGGVRNFTYDAQGRVVSQDDGDGVNAITYTRNSASTVVTDALGKQTTYEYTKNRGFSVITKIIDPAGKTVTLSYDASQNLTSATDELGRTVNYSYDSRGNVISFKDPAGNISRASYEPTFNRPTSLTNPLNRSVALSYNAKGDLTDLKDPLSNLTQFTYDAQGHVTTIQDALGHVVQFTYKASNGALESVTDPLNRTAQFQTDALSRLTRVTDPKGRQASYVYNTAGDLTSMTDALGGVTALGYQFGRNGNVPVQITDAKQHSMTFEYDTVGRPKKVVNALGQEATVVYDSKSRPQNVTSRRNQQMSFTYDDLDRLTQLTTPEGNLTIGYDAAGNYTSVTKYNGSQVALAYDSLDRIIQEVQTLPGGPTVTLSYTYDANGNRTRMTTPWGSFRYTYDKLDRPSSVTDPQGLVYSFAYDAVGRRTTKTYPNGTQTTYVYDAASQVTGIRHRRISDDATLAFADYTYDDAGNRLTMTDTAGQHSYSYDNGHRLISATHPQNSLLPQKNETFTYDAAHNCTADADIAGYVYDEADRLQSNSSYTYTNDADGNRTSKTGAEGQTQYVWDSSNQLIQVQRPDGVTVDYTYDGMGRAVQMTVTTDTMTTTKFVRDGSAIIATLDGSNNLTGLYTHSGTGREPLSLRRGASSYYLHDDILSSIVAATGQSGQIVERAEYASYGQPVFVDQAASTATASFIGNVYAYTGAERSAEIGLSRHGIRYLDIQIGRWISEEPFGLDGTNRYWYANSNPYRFVDNSGAQAAEATQVAPSIVNSGPTAQQVINGLRVVAPVGPGLALIPLPPILLYGGGLLVIGYAILLVDKRAKERVLAPSSTGWGTVRGPGGPGRVRRFASCLPGSRRLVIGRGDDLKQAGALGANEYKLQWPDTGSRKSEWAMNKKLLENEMRNMNPIRDASPDDRRRPQDHTGGGLYLYLERWTLKHAGWAFDKDTNLWMPPGK